MLNWHHRQVPLDVVECLVGSRPVGIFFFRRKVRTTLRESLLVKALQLSGMLTGSC